jgi:NAD(P)-dependent dehydrogenase (short-subunit alcohol dehydrogenase family)
MDLDLNGAKVIVTAGASGIGREIVQAFHEEGARIATCDVDEDALAKLATDLPDLQTAQCDVTDADAVAAFIEGAADWMGGIDALINNAGIAGPTARVEDVDPGDWARCIDVVLTGQFNCTRIAIPHLRKSKNGSITNMSSAAGKMGFALRTPYAAAKWGVIGFTKSLSIELGPDAIRVNAILPGIVEGDRQRRVMEARAQSRGMSMSEIKDEAFSFASIKDWVTPRQLADQVLFLASPRGRSISGQALAIDGDLRMLA